MSSLSKEEFIQLCSSTVAEGLSQIYIPEIIHALEQAALGEPAIIWLQGASCSGCSVSLLNSVHPKLRNSLADIISYTYPKPPFAPAERIKSIYSVAEQHKGNYYMVIEGAVPTGADGRYCIIGEDADGRVVTLLELVQKLGESAKAVIAVGTCAAYGGLSAAKPNPTQCVGISEIFRDLPLVNIPGCPPHPDWVIGTLAHIILYEIPELDNYKRPKVLTRKPGFKPDRSSLTVLDKVVGFTENRPIVGTERRGIGK